MSPVVNGSFLVLSFLTVLSILFLRAWLRSSARTSDATSATTAGNASSDTHQQVPFFFIPPSYNTKNGSDPPFIDLARALDNYQQNAENTISSMVLAFETARKTEWSIFPNHDDDSSNSNNFDNFSSKLEEKIKKTAELLEANYFVLEKMLKPFDIVLALPSPTTSPTLSTSLREGENSHFEAKTDQWTWKGGNEDNENKAPSSYDSAAQVICHIVRDYSTLGYGIRQSLYGWIIDQLKLFQTQKQKHRSVLVPGAGLGRLALEIYNMGCFHVEANELSLVMSSAAYQLLHQIVDGEMYPFVSDFLMNEVNSKDRYQKIRFPDGNYYSGRASVDDNDCRNDANTAKRKDCCSALDRSSLSYTVGDFVEIYSTQERMAGYGHIVTCFFIDTASNIYEYVLVVRNLLASHGVWINVGPLQWHGNSKLNPASDELRSIIESMGFIIHSWTIDDEAINYRHDDIDKDSRYTKFEGYRPLRFVVSLPLRSKLGLDQVNVKDQILKIRQSFAKNSRSSREFDRNVFSNVTIEELS